jgi:tripartite-type tricarboxylate transporter receptor subunit TctC
MRVARARRARRPAHFNRGNRMTTLYRCAVLGLLLVCCVFRGAALAQDWPAKGIRIVVPTVPGGAGDYTARLVSRWMSEAWGHQVIIDNRPGGAGNIGADIVAKAAPDGYTQLMPITSFPINPSLYPKMPFDTLRDLELIAKVAYGPLILVITPSLPATTVAGFIDLAKSRPGRLNYANSGNGTSAHLAGELFKKMAGVDLVSIYYKGGGPALIDVISGQVQAYFSTIPAAIEHVRSGRLRALGVTSLVRVPELPNIPTVAEEGVPGFEVGVWFGVLGPTGIALPIRQKINGLIAKSVQTAEARERLAVQGLVPGSGNLGELREFLRNDVAKWGKVVREAGIKAD